jgi:zinc transport system substrate-binding protein
LLTLALLTVFIISCAPQAATLPADDGANAPINITVSILPQKYLVERVGGSHVKVNAMVVEGASPHTYEPKPEQMRELANSAAYFIIGVEYENTWLDRIQDANPDMQIVDMSEGIERIPMVEHHHEGEEQEGDEEHEESGLDPHVWTSPRLVKLMANNILAALVKLDPDHQIDFEQNMQVLNADIDQLDESIKSTLEGSTDRSFIVFHPAWGYFAQDYNLRQIPIEVEGQEPSPQELVNIINEAKAEHSKVVFAQPGISTKTADTIAQEINGEVVLINPLEENWLENLQKVAEAFASALK